MKIWTSEHIFEHPWETVVQATWKKYPNPMNPNVVGLDTVDRRVDRRGILHTHRLMATEWGMPDWLTKFIGLNQRCYVSEHSEVDAQKHKMSLRSRNLTFCNFITIDENMVYTKNPTNPDNTLLKQETVINVNGVPMTDYLEGVVLGSVNSNADKGRDALEWVISRIKDDAHDLARTIKGDAQVMARTANTLAKETLKELKTRPI